MKRTLLLFFCFYLLQFTDAYSQSTEEMVTAFRVSDTSQSHCSQIYYNDLSVYRDTTLYLRRVDSLNHLIGENPDKRVHIRAVMYQVLGARLFDFPKEKYIQMLKSVISEAYGLGDEQLSSELYGMYGDYNDWGSPDYVLYNAKALEIQKRIGFEHFAYIPNRLANIANILYHDGDYTQSISYAFEGLNMIKASQLDASHRSHILILDILGASYKMLGKYDSVEFYYREILKTLPVVAPLEPHPIPFQKLWEGIAQGNIGIAISKSLDLPKAMPLLQEYLKVSFELSDTSNIILAQNALGNAYLDNHEYAAALNSFKRAWRLGGDGQDLDQGIVCCTGMANVYRLMGRPDSAFYYYDKSSALAKEKDLAQRQHGLERIQAQVDFDELQSSLMKSNFLLNREKNRRYFILMGLFLGGIIILLYYNRQRLMKNKKILQIRHLHELAEKEVENAKQQLETFKQHVLEKDRLIKLLQEKLDSIKDIETEQAIADLLRESLPTEEDWLRFKDEFIKAYPLFLVNLKKRMINPSPAEERLSILIFLKLDNPQIAQTLGISKDSVGRSKRRLRANIGDLPQEQSLEGFILSLA